MNVVNFKRKLQLGVSFIKFPNLAKAIYRAYNRYSIGKSTRFKGKPPTEHIRPEILTYSLKPVISKIPVKEEKEAK